MANMEYTETDATARLAWAATVPQPVTEGRVYLVTDSDGSQRLLDTDSYDPSPRRIVSSRTVRDAESFLTYFGKHRDAERTEVWADRESSTIIAVLDAHAGSDGDWDPDFRPGWEKHRLTLALRHTPAWLAWIGLNGKLVGQAAFAEHVETRSVDIVDPSAAAMLELAQSFQATRKAEFKGGQRLSNGEVKLEYVENLQGKAGTRNDIEIPEVIKLALRPYEGSEVYGVKARFRWRLNDGVLSLGYQLERPEDVLEAAFNDIVGSVKAGIGDTPLLYGKP